MIPRRFALVRHVDYTGVSGVGVVAYGVMFGGGQVALRWCSAHPSLSVWDSLDDLVTIHGDGDAMAVEWLDEQYDDTAIHEAVSRHRAAVTARRSKHHAEMPTVPIANSIDNSSASPLSAGTDGDFPQPPIRPEPVEPEPVPTEPPAPPEPEPPRPEPPVHPRPVEPEPVPPGRPEPPHPEPPHPEPPRPDPPDPEPPHPEPPQPAPRHSAGRHRRKGSMESGPLPLTPNEAR